MSEQSDPSDSVEIAVPADRRVLMGEELGAATRRELDLDALDRQPAGVRVRIDTQAVTSSFLRGLFAPSILALGLDRFTRKYQLIASTAVRDILRANAEFVTQENAPPPGPARRGPERRTPERRARVA